ncbi:MAG: hypothetical protein WCF93_03825 [Candidatus Moraniibacteriota bacterium]
MIFFSQLQPGQKFVYACSLVDGEDGIFVYQKLNDEFYKAAQAKDPKFLNYEDKLRPFNALELKNSALVSVEDATEVFLLSI